MSRRGVFALCVAVTLVTGLVTSLWHRPQTYVRNYENVLGTSMSLKVTATSAAAVDRAEAVVLAEIDRHAKILSGYDPSSEFSQWFRSHDDARTVSPELFDVLSRFDVWRTRTRGALDPSAETISRVWKAAAAANRLPNDAEISRAVADAEQTHWRLDYAAHTATHLSTAPLVLNSFAKSYIIERAARAGFATEGVRGIVVNIGDQPSDLPGGCEVLR